MRKASIHCFGTRSSGCGQRQKRYEGAVGITRKVFLESIEPLLNNGWTQLLHEGVYQQHFMTCGTQQFTGREQFQGEVRIGAAEVGRSVERPVRVNKSVLQATSSAINSGTANRGAIASELACQNAWID